MPTGTLGLRLRRIITPARVRLAIDLKLEWTSGSTTELTRRHGALSPSAMAVTGTLRFYNASALRFWTRVSPAGPRNSPAWTTPWQHRQRTGEHQALRRKYHRLMGGGWLGPAELRRTCLADLTVDRRAHPSPKKAGGRQTTTAPPRTSRENPRPEAQRR